MTDTLRATYLIETPLEPARVAEVLAGEQSSGTFVRVAGETDALRQRSRATVSTLEELEPLPAPSLPSAWLQRHPPSGPWRRARVTVDFPLANIGHNLPTLWATLALVAVFRLKLGIAVVLGGAAALGLALTAVLAGPEVAQLGYHFALYPVGLNSIGLLLIALLFNNALRRQYPHRPLEHGNVHKTRDPLPRDRLGFTPAVAPGDEGQRGMAGMSERVSLLNGRLTVVSQPGQGTHIDVLFPWPPRARERANTSKPHDL